MVGGQARSQHLVGVEEVAKIGAGVPRTHRAAAAIIRRPQVLAERGVADVHSPLPRLAGAPVKTRPGRCRTASGRCRIRGPGTVWPTAVSGAAPLWPSRRRRGTPGTRPTASPDHFPAVVESPTPAPG